MRTYHCAELWVYAFEPLHFYATDPELVKWAESEVRLLYPKCKTSEASSAHVRFDKIDNGGKVTVWHLLKLLCARGWEPVGCSEGDSSIRYLLRLAIDG